MRDLPRAGRQGCAPVKHLPFESGDCLQCHKAHTSAQRSLLVEPAAQLSRKTRHIVSVTDYGLDEQHGCYLVMERLKGETLDQLIARVLILSPAQAPAAPGSKPKR